jgi:L-fucose mutarotase
MLKGIPAILSPDLLKILMEMGHTDEIVIADGNFPAVTCAKRIVRLDGIGVPEVLDAVLKLFPLDTYVKKPITLMKVVQGDPYQPTIWDTYKTIVSKYESRPDVIENIDKFEFYKQAKEAFAVITTGETALYANIILKKGVVLEDGK